RLITLIWRDQYCSDCKISRRALSFTERVKETTRTCLYCSGCQRYHPTCLFTPTERRVEPRFCVGHTGYVRLCKHKVVKWRQIMAATKKIKNKRPYTVSECRKKSHSKACQWRLVRWLFGHKPSNSSSVCPRNPRLVLLKDDSGYKIKLSWGPHLDLLFIKDAVSPVTALTRELDKFRMIQTRFTCPEMAPGKIVESRVFDPNNCGCLKRLNQGWEPSFNHEVLRLSNHGCLDQHRKISRLSPLVWVQGGWKSANRSVLGRSSGSSSATQSVANGDSHH
ncbi:hypothetical protein QBC35DRAFT_392971, partial [Podospora australis]